MWIVRIHTPGKRPPSGSTFFAGCKADWQRVRVKGEAVVATAAHIPDDYPKLEQVRDLARGLSSTIVVGDDRVELLSAVAAASAKPAPDRLTDDELRQQMLYRLQEIATTNGWTAIELGGTAMGGDPGERGGRSPIHGMTLVELTLTRPPIDWPELQAAGRPPWESPDWAPPGPAWVHPSWPEKPKPVEEPPVPKPAATEPVEEPVDPPPAVELPPDTVPDTDTDTDPAGEDDAYPAEHAAAAREILLDLVKRKGGEVPHFNAVGFLLKKAGLPRLTTKQIAAMLATTT